VIAFFLAALRDWREARLRRTICASAGVLAAAALAGPLQPLILAIASAAVFVASGWTEGNSPKRAGGEGLDPLSFPARPRSIVAGRALSALFIWLALAFSLSPILAASAIAWGLSRATIMSCLLCWSTAYMAAASAGFCSKLLFTGSNGLLGLCLYLLWIFSSFFVAWLKFSNPFVQAWSLLKLEGGTAPYWGICFEAMAAALLLALSALSLGGRGRKRDA
jgi:hypothetical protein